MTRLLASRGRHAGAPVAEDRLARRKGRHCRRFFSRPAAEEPTPVVDDFSRVRRPALVAFPIAADPFPRLPEYRHPYDSQRGAA